MKFRKKRENIFIIYRKYLILFKTQKLDVLFKLSRMLVTHDREKFSWVGELFQAEHLQGRYGYTCVRVTLLLCKHVV